MKMIENTKYKETDELFEDEDDEQIINNTYLVFEVKNEKYCFNIKYVQEIIKLNDVHYFPDMSDYERGVIRLRHMVVPVIDLRQLWNMQSLEEEKSSFIEMLKHREDDHIAWVDELLMSVAERREFTLNLDPHACTFGKWYDHYKTDNLLISSFLKKFEQPHKDVHLFGAKINSIIASGDYEEADRLVPDIYLLISDLIDLFNGLTKIVLETNRDVAIICNYNSKLIAFSVDAMDRVLQISEDKFEESDVSNDEYLKSVTKIGQSVVHRIDMEKLLELMIED